MKVKEYPGSLWRMACLKATPLRTLRQPPRDPLPLTVSITSIPSRLTVLPLVIRSLLTQNRPAERIILWLNHELEGQLPRALTQLTGPVFEIRFRDQTCSHRKLVFALAEQPSTTVVTCDDDLMYHPDCLDRLFETHTRYPECIIGNECRRVTYNEIGDLEPYKQWPWEQPGQSHANTLPIGFGGTLYPPHSLHQDATDASLYQALAPRADDLWFKLMSYLAETPSRRTLNPPPKPMPIPSSQSFSLAKTNVKQDGNRAQWAALTAHYEVPWQAFRNQSD